jgi:hypothetical protein
VTNSTKIAPSNSLLFVSDPDGGDPPRPARDEQILATDSCISVACYPFIDGETAVTLGAAREVDPGYEPAFDGKLATPNRAIVISTVEHKTILSATVPETITRIRAWVNKPSMADQVIIGFD